VGRVWCRGPSLLHSYFGRADRPVVEGWLDTGDLGARWEGELFLTGRAKDLIILRGQNHLPQDFERAADAVPGVRTGCSAAVAAHSEEGERLVLFVEARSGGEATAEGLAEACRRAVLAATGVEPHLVLVLEPGTLPRTSSGKMRRGEALRRWQAGSLTPPDKVGPWMMAGALARSALGYLGGWRA
jgi:acyl-CoA synthetase (AMP-forming)/AMP-acid ligase II